MGLVRVKARRVVQDKEVEGLVVYRTRLLHTSCIPLRCSCIPVHFCLYFPSGADLFTTTPLFTIPSCLASHQAHTGSQTYENAHTSGQAAIFPAETLTYLIQVQIGEEMHRIAYHDNAPVAVTLRQCGSTGTLQRQPCTGPYLGQDAWWEQQASG